MMSEVFVWEGIAYKCFSGDYLCYELMRKGK